MVTKKSTSSLPKNLKRRAAAWAGKLTRLAKSFAPDHLKPYISSKVEDKEGGQFIIRLITDKNKRPLQKFGSLDARAQEFGSGEHSKRGTKQKYPITPKDKKYLAFYWEVATNNPDRFSFLPDGRVMFSKVMHPGIEAANDGIGYMAPAMKELKRQARQDLDEDVRKAIADDLRIAFAHAKRKK